ncbi:hypothetical protein QBC46DRAFT_82353 [Diplogelasinospora grovesii]|uniref:Uncharacterized protein n=1 Tax=Diplogelasinospora grovesii TaxID=303347 RepID=A0AAN6NB43_9PEZI|nr:hypothetical protein QBC46DRAFT_82353 [Diplogelasinospora grovesii]
MSLSSLRASSLFLSLARSLARYTCIMESKTNVPWGACETDNYQLNTLNEKEKNEAPGKDKESTKETYWHAPLLKGGKIGQDKAFWRRSSSILGRRLNTKMRTRGVCYFASSSLGYLSILTTKNSQQDPFFKFQTETKSVVKACHATPRPVQDSGQLELPSLYSPRY